MAIPIELAQSVVEELQGRTFANLFAQAHAKHVLHEVRESPDNFPAFDLNLEGKVTAASYSLLAAGCSLAEQGDRASGNAVIERAASLLQYAQGPRSASSLEGAFHALVSAMAFYSAGQYSRAFVAIRNVGQHTDAGSAIGAWLRRDAVGLTRLLSTSLLRDRPLFQDASDLEDAAINTAICRAIGLASDFSATGVHRSLEAADEQLKDAQLVASAKGHSAWWLITRLLRLMLSDHGEASPWSVLPKFFGPQQTLALGRYNRLLAFGRSPVTQLWISQRQALPLALNLSKRGAVINLRTSGGKTRVAELAILQALSSHPSAKVLYLAPFRSLALEIERTLSSTFSWLGFEVSHLYGGARASSVDSEIVAQSAITIATPEKAKALLRAAPELFAEMKLVVIDEGHLLGADYRDIRNELFVDHLRDLARNTGARFLLMSAVLPNAEQLAEWVADDSASVARSDWKPSAERFGLLRWNGSRVRIEWKGAVESFNPYFIEAKPLGFGKRRKSFPDDKTEAIAATAVRLSEIGPVMVFTGFAKAVPGLARAVLLALGQQPPDHLWPAHEWDVFEAVCEEELEPGALELVAARAGVVCHSNRLTPQVRLALEHLMRAAPPKVVIATSTLAQGVNIGVSSVIIANPYVGAKSRIDHRDFWNICGRAGRAFVDGEGKILYAIDDTRAGWQIQRDLALARDYYRTDQTEPAQSGLLLVIKALRNVALRSGVAFEVLLDLVADNDFALLGESANKCAEWCDLIDDELLARRPDSTATVSEDGDESWVDRAFQDSLAAIQARSGVAEIGEAELFAFLRARSRAASRRVPVAARAAVIASGLSLRAALRMNQSLDLFSEIADGCVWDRIASLAQALLRIEDWARVNATSVVPAMPDPGSLEFVRTGWLAGLSLRSLVGLNSEAPTITRDLYGYQLPWIIHAASQQLRVGGEATRADVLGRLALLTELGVPTIEAAQVFLAGIRSRVAATELGSVGIAIGSTVADVRRNLRNQALLDLLCAAVSPGTAKWLALVQAADQLHAQPRVPSFEPFAIEPDVPADVLHARSSDAGVFLTTADWMFRRAVVSTEVLPFDVVANDPRFAFVRDGGIWRLDVRDPRLETL